MNINAKINTSIKGRFGLSVVNSNGELVKEKTIPNTQNAVSYDGAAKILTAFADQPDLGDSYYCKVGTGSTELTRSATGLNTPLAPVSSTDRPSRNDWNETDNLDGTVTYQITWSVSFSIGAITGTISEVGLYCDADDVFFAGQLIKDESGNPTTLTLLADEQLLVDYTMEVTGPLQGTSIATGTVDADGVSTNYTVYAQPLLKFYNINSSTDTSVRYESDIRYVYLLGSDGTSLRGSKTITPYSATHDGAGTVTFNGGTVTFAPSDFASSDVKYVSFSNNTSVGDIDTATVTEESGSFVGAVFIVEFTPALNKPSNKTLSFQFDFDVNV